jgi:hypothetical protein
MTEPAATRVVRVGAPDDALIKAIAEHRTAKAGWRIGLLDPSLGDLEPDALVILEFDAPAADQALLDRLQGGARPNRVLVLGGSGLVLCARSEGMKRPIRLGALLARIDAYWEPYLEDTAIVLGPYEFLASDRALLLPFDEEIIRLTELETKLLSCLADASGALVGREQLLAEVWGYSGDADTHTVETHIWRLRQKIETDDPATRFLITEPGGYRLLLADRTTDG